MADKATGPRSPEGMARASRNAFRGGHRPTLRDLAKVMLESAFGYLERRWELWA